MGGNESIFAVLIPWAVTMYVLYWVIRAGVRDGVRQASKRDSEDLQTDRIHRED